MSVVYYAQLQLPRPEHLGDEHWQAICTEVDRLQRSLEAGDRGQILGDLKCLVESVSRVTLEIAGDPQPSNAAFDTCVNKAHRLLESQPGQDLALSRVFRNLAEQSKKMANSMGNVRNEFGGGHGRALLPTVETEMLYLSLDGSLMWVRWALRRLGFLTYGRPEDLIRDLIEVPQSFYRGVLEDRLKASNMAALDPRHQRALGVAVGQRCMRGTFVVRWDGLDPCVSSDDLELWPEGYRAGLAHGLLFDPSGSPTVNAFSIEQALKALDPVADASEYLNELVNMIVDSTPDGLPSEDEVLAENVRKYVHRRITSSPSAERLALMRLERHIARYQPF
jgi:hypothetical protein